MEQDLEEQLCLASLPVAFSSKYSLANTLTGFLDTILEKVTEFPQPLQLKREFGRHHRLWFSNLLSQDPSEEPCSDSGTP